MKAVRLQVNTRPVDLPPSITSITPKPFRRGPNGEEGRVAGGGSPHKAPIIKRVKTKRRQDDQSVLLVFIMLESCCFTLHVQHGCFTTVRLTPNSIMSITGFRFPWFELLQLSYIYIYVLKKKKSTQYTKKKARNKYRHCSKHSHLHVSFLRHETWSCNRSSAWFVSVFQSINQASNRLEERNDAEEEEEEEEGASRLETQTQEAAALKKSLPRTITSLPAQKMSARTHTHTRQHVNGKSYSGLYRRLISSISWSHRKHKQTARHKQTERNLYVRQQLGTVKEKRPGWRLTSCERWRRTLAASCRSGRTWPSRGRRRRQSYWSVAF